MLTLTQYLNQKEPLFMPHVYLQKGEYSIGNFGGAIGHKFASVWINGLDGIEYAAKEGSNTVWATDSDGNPRRITHFHLPNNYSDDI